MSPSPSPDPTSYPNPNQAQTQTPNPAQKPVAPPITTPSPWTHEETLNLLQTYQQLWYSVNRGQLKASQWDQVALSIADKCGFLQPSKSGTQCRHKMEKLRKRFRAEKLKMDPAGPTPLGYHPWIYFPLMDQLERGIPISHTPTPPPHRHNNNTNTRHNLEQNEGYDYDGCGGFEYEAKHRVGWNGDDMNEDDVGARTRKRGRRSDEWEGEGDERRGGAIGELAGEMKGFVERFVMVERKKMEVMRENERFRLDMENKRLEMILLAHHKTADLISKAFAASLNNEKVKLKVNPTQE